MTEIRNSCGKLLCRVDIKTKTVEIVIKGQKTLIQLLDNEVKITNVCAIAQFKILIKYFRRPLDGMESKF